MSTTMAACLAQAMSEGRKMSLSEIYLAVKRQCTELGRPLPPQWEAMVRRTLQSHCASCPQYRKRGDYFVWHERGTWSCKVSSRLVEGPTPHRSVMELVNEAYIRQRQASVDRWKKHALARQLKRKKERAALAALVKLGIEV